MSEIDYLNLPEIYLQETEIWLRIPVNDHIQFSIPEGFCHQRD